MEEIMEAFRAFAEIFNSLGPTGSLIAILIFVVWYQNRGVERDDKFRTDLLALHAKTVQGIEKSTENTGNITTLLERHEKSAQERSDAQYIRDRERLGLLAKISEYMAIFDKTQSTVDNIESTAIRIQGNIADIQTDIPSLIERKHSETKKDLAAIKGVMIQNHDLIEQTLSKIKLQNEQVLLKMQDDSVSDDLRRILRTQTDTLGIVQNVVTNNHRLLETLTTIKLSPMNEENKADDEAKQIVANVSDISAAADAGVSSDGAGSDGRADAGRDADSGSGTNGDSTAG